MGFNFAVVVGGLALLALVVLALTDHITASIAFAIGVH